MACRRPALSRGRAGAGLAAPGAWVAARRYVITLPCIRVRPGTTPNPICRDSANSGGYRNGAAFDLLPPVSQKKEERDYAFRQPGMPAR